MSLKSKLNGIKQIWQFDNRWQLLITRTFFPGEKLNVYKYKGLEFLTDHQNGEANGAREILTTEMYRSFLSKMKLPTSINVLDLGSNNGGFPLLLLSENYKFNKLVCVELNPHTFSRMKFNIERNVNCEFHPFNAAVCGENKILNISLGQGGTADNIYNSEPTDNSKYKIQGRTFDDIYNETFGDEIVDVCKIDVEGAEFDIFQSEGFTKIKNCKFILMEIHHEKNRKRSVILNILEKLKFHELTDKTISDINENHFVHLFANSEL